MTNILIVEDEPVQGKILKAALEKLAYQVTGPITSGEQAVQFLENNRPNLILMDIMLSGTMDGIETARAIQNIADIPVIYLTSETDPGTLQRAAKTQPYGYILKPFQQSQLFVTIESALLKHELEKNLHESEAHYRAIVEDQEELISRHTYEGKITFANEAYARFFGKQPADMIGTSIYDWVTPESVDFVKNNLASLSPDNPSILHEGMTRNSLGEPHIHQWKNRLILDKNGSPREYQSLGIDITERKKIEENEQQQRLFAKALSDTAAALNSTLEMEDVLTRILENIETVIPHGAVNVMLLDDDNNLLYFSQRGYEDSQKFENAIKSYWDNQFFQLPNLVKMVATQKVVLISDTLTHTDWKALPETEWIQSYVGAPIFVDDHLVGFINLDSAVPGFFSPTHAEHLQAFVNHAAAAIKNARLFKENQEHIKQLRHREQIMNAVNRSAETLLSAMNWQTAIHDVLEILGQGTKAGRVCLFNMQANQMEDLFSGLHFEWIDPQWQNTFQFSQQQVTAFQKNALVSWREKLKANQIIHKSVLDSPQEEDTCYKIMGIHSCVIAPIFVFGEWWGFIGYFDFTGQVTWSKIEVEAMGTAAAIIGVAVQREISEIKLKESKHMSEIGSMAAGIAHELNSPLQVIIGAAEGLIKQANKKKLTLDQAYLQRLELIRRNAWRSAELMRAVQVYSRNVLLHKESLMLNDLVKDALLLVEEQFRHEADIEIITELADDIALFYFDHKQMLQVIVNLLNNARDAMPDGGRVFVRTEMAPDRQKIVLQVADQGTGIPANIQKKIFKPFFTTKPIGKGMGLGLSIVKGVVDSHGGEIRVQSEKQKGSTFILLFPLDHNSPQDQ